MTFSIAIWADTYKLKGVSMVLVEHEQPDVGVNDEAFYDACTANMSNGLPNSGGERAAL